MIKVIKNGTVITMDENREKTEKLDIVIKENKIIKIEKHYEGPADLLIDASDKIVMPGLINCHTHLGMSIFRATNDSLNLDDWLNKKIWPIENKLTDKDIYYTTLLSCLEMIKTGTTTNNNMYFGWKESINAIKETKIRQMFTTTLMGNMDKSSIDRIQSFIELYDKYKNEGLIKFTVSPHALYTSTKEYLVTCKELADKLKLPIHIHFSENKDEVKNMTKQYGEKPVYILKELGYLENKLILAHGTFIDKDEQDLLKNKDISICHNPISNLNLGCGIADITSYIKNNINVCLGTDGQGSGNNLNMFYHMSFVDLLQKAKYQDPTIMSSYDVLKLATVNGAKALGIKDIGKIKENYKADIIILDLNDIENYPTPEIINAVVHQAYNSVDTTIINGEILMQNKKINLDIDEKKLKNQIDNIIKTCV